MTESDTSRPNESATVGMTPSDNEALTDLRERCRFKDLADVRDIAIAHALSNELKPKKPKGATTIWSKANLDADLVTMIRLAYPDSDPIETAQSLLHVGAVELANHPDFKSWTEFTDIPGVEFPNETEE